MATTRRSRTRRVEASKDDDCSLSSVPLIDGCDILRWKKEKLLQCSSSLKSILNIGASLTMFRRESQWPLSSNFAKSALVWARVKSTLSECCNIRKMADIIYHDEYKELVQVDNSLKMVTIFLAEYEQTKYQLLYWVPHLGGNVYPLIKHLPV